MSQTLSSRRMLVGVAVIALLAGCGKSDDDASTDPLDEDVMADSELSGDAAGGETGLSTAQRSPEAIAAARQDAAKKAGGTLENASPAAGGEVASLFEGAARAAQVSDQSRADATDCAAKVAYSASWADRLPDALAVYPRAAVQEAAGVAAEDCAMNAVTFVTPVDAKDVIDYYYTRARKAGYGVDYLVEGGDHVLGGSNAGKAYVVSARSLDDGVTEVDLIASGK